MLSPNPLKKTEITNCELAKIVVEIKFPVVRLIEAYS
jgi:hypothetical protein